MRLSAAVKRLSGCVLLTLLTQAVVCVAQDPQRSVYIPNPTPRDPDLKEVFHETPADQEKQRVISIKNQIRAREIWLETNQIMLLAQQLQQEILSDKKSTSMETNATKAGQIEKLAKSVQQQMRDR